MKEIDSRSREIDAFVASFNRSISNPGASDDSGIEVQRILLKGKRRKLVKRTALSAIVATSIAAIALTLAPRHSSLTTRPAIPAASHAGAASGDPVRLIDAARIAFGEELRNEDTSGAGDPNDLTTVIPSGMLLVKASLTSFATCEEYRVSLYPPGGTEVEAQCSATRLPNGSQANVWEAQAAVGDTRYRSVEVKTRDGLWLVVNYSGSSSQVSNDLKSDSLRLAEFAKQSRSSSTSGEKTLEWQVAR